MFSFQGTPGGSLNPKEFWVENCNMNERFLWLNKDASPGIGPFGPELLAPAVRCCT